MKIRLTKCGTFLLRQNSVGNLILKNSQFSNIIFLSPKSFSFLLFQDYTIFIFKNSNSLAFLTFENISFYNNTFGSSGFYFDNQASVTINKLNITNCLISNNLFIFVATNQKIYFNSFIVFIQNKIGLKNINI